MEGDLFSFCCSCLYPVYMSFTYRIVVCLYSVWMTILCVGCRSGNNTNEQNIVKKSFNKVNTVGVRVVKVTEKPFYKELLSNGIAHVIHKATIPFKLNDQIIKIYVRNGMRVKKGDLLARLEGKSVQSNFLSAKIQYDKSILELADKMLGYGFVLKDSVKMRSEMFRMVKIRSGYDDASIRINKAKNELSHIEVRSH